MELTDDDGENNGSIRENLERQPGKKCSREARSPIELAAMPVFNSDVTLSPPVDTGIPCKTRRVEVSGTMHAEKMSTEGLSDSEKLDLILCRLQKIENNLCRIDEIDAKVEKLREGQGEVEKSLEFAYVAIDKLNAKVSKCETDNNNLRSRQNDLEDRLRRNNLVFYNVPEKAEGSDCSKFIQSFIETHMGLESGMEIQRAHIVPVNAMIDKMKPRPICVAFLRFHNKETVRRSAAERLTKKPFQGNSIYISEDYCTATRVARKLLVPILRELKIKKPDSRPFIYCLSGSIEIS